MEEQKASHDSLASALSAAQAEFKDPYRASTNPHFKSKYADLQSTLAAVRPVLSKHGLAIVQSTTFEAGTLLLVTRLLWRDQQVIGYYPVIPVRADPQGYGSAMTYARRYTLASMLGVASDPDDDGNAASETPKAGPVVSLAGILADVDAATTSAALKKSVGAASALTDDERATLKTRYLERVKELS